jgi:hypothetical protein
MVRFDVDPTDATPCHLHLEAAGFRMIANCALDVVLRDGRSGLNAGRAKHGCRWTGVGLAIDEGIDDLAV